MQGSQRNQLLEPAFHLGGDQRRRREPFPAMHHAMANALQPLTVGCDRRQQPTVEHLLQNFVLGQAASLMPKKSPGGIHQGRLEAGTAQIDHQAEIRHQRTSQVISTFSGSTAQMLLQYSLIERSEEKNPVRAVFSSDIRFQCIRSLQARLTASCARR